VFRYGPEWLRQLGLKVRDLLTLEQPDENDGTISRT